MDAMPHGRYLQFQREQNGFQLVVLIWSKPTMRVYNKIIVKKVLVSCEVTLIEQWVRKLIRALGLYYKMVMRYSVKKRGIY